MGRRRLKAARNWLTILFLGTLLTFGYVNCSGVSFVSNPNGPGTFNGPEPGVAITPTDLPQCDRQVIGDLPASCIVFWDSFEREELVDHDVFHWDFVTFDNGGNGIHLSASIENSNHLGPTFDQDRAVLFTGREGSSRHEIYLASKPLPVDLSSFSGVYIQFHYLPVHLEDSIFIQGVDIAESIRVDVCKSGVDECNDNSVVQSMTHWDRYPLDENELGRDLNIRDYNFTDWKLGQVYVDLSDYDVDRRKNFVFKVSTAMTDGYKNNNKSNELDDGIILDNLIVVAVKTLVDP